MTSKRPGEAVEPVKAARKGWARLPSFTPAASACARTAASRPAASQLARSRNACASAANRSRAALIQQLRRVRIQNDRSWGKIESSAAGEVNQRRGAWLESRHSGLEPRPPGRVDAQPLGLEARRDQRDELGIVDLAQMVGVQAGQPRHVEAGGAAADRVEVEPLDRLRGRDHLVVAMAPAQAQQVIAHGFREKAHVPIGLDCKRAVALGQLGAIGAVDQGNVREDGRIPVERSIKLHLARGVHQVIVTADDVGDRHVVVVHDHREHVGRRAVGAQQHHVVQLRVGEAHLALHSILDDRFAGARRLQPDHRCDPRRRVGRIAIAPAAVVDGAPSLRTRLRPHLRELLRRAVAKISCAARQQLPRHLGVPLLPF